MSDISQIQWKIEGPAKIKAYGGRQLAILQNIDHCLC